MKHEAVTFCGRVGPGYQRNCPLLEEDYGVKVAMHMDENSVAAYVVNYHMPALERALISACASVPCQQTRTWLWSDVGALQTTHNARLQVRMTSSVQCAARCRYFADGSA